MAVALTLDQEQFIQSKLSGGKYGSQVIEQLKDRCQ
jgi:hypothetical protein